MTLDDIDALFKNEYFQDKLKRRLFRTPYTLVASLGALVGLGSLTAAVLFFGNKVSELRETIVKIQKTVDDGQKKIDQLGQDTDAFKRGLDDRYSHAKEDLTKEVDSVRAMGAGLNSSAAVVTDAVKLAADSVRGTQASLDEEQRRLLQQFGELDANRVKNQKAQEEIADTQKEIQQKNVLLGNTTENARRAIASADQLQRKVQDLSSFKTFELVTLRSHALKRVALKHIRSADAPAADYTMEFQSQGLRRPVEIAVTVHRDGAEGDLVLTYPNVVPDNPVTDRWPSFCICGTPWMFQGENWVQSPFVKDFLTMRIIGRQASCELPRNYSRAECVDVSSDK